MGVVGERAYGFIRYVIALLSNNRFPKAEKEHRGVLVKASKQRIRADYHYTEDQAMGYQ
jgi:hypothetical protein